MTPFRPKFDDCFECKNWASRKCTRCTAGEFFEEDDTTVPVDEINPFDVLKNMDSFDDE